MDKKSSLSRKPEKADVNSFINKGLSTPAKGNNGDNEISRLQLRLPKTKVQQIDEVLNKKRVRISRHHWILEAIEEKLEREEDV